MDHKADLQRSTGLAALLEAALGQESSVGCHIVGCYRGFGELLIQVHQGNSWCKDGEDKDFVRWEYRQGFVGRDSLELLLGDLIK